MLNYHDQRICSKCFRHIHTGLIDMRQNEQLMKHLMKYWFLTERNAQALLRSICNQCIFEISAREETTVLKAANVQRSNKMDQPHKDINGIESENNEEIERCRRVIIHSSLPIINTTPADSPEGQTSNDISINGRDRNHDHGHSDHYQITPINLDVGAGKIYHQSHFGSVKSKSHLSPPNKTDCSLLEAYDARSLAPLETESGGETYKQNSEKPIIRYTCPQCGKMYQRKHFHVKHVRTCKRKSLRYAKSLYAATAAADAARRNNGQMGINHNENNYDVFTDLPPTPPSPSLSSINGGDADGVPGTRTTKSCITIINTDVRNAYKTATEAARIKAAARTTAVTTAAATTIATTIITATEAMQEIVKPKRLYYCDYCSMTTDRIEKMSKHKRLHLTQYNCNTCGQVYTSLYEYEFHCVICLAKKEARDEQLWEDSSVITSATTSILRKRRKRNNDITGDNGVDKELSSTLSSRRLTRSISRARSVAWSRAATPSSVISTMPRTPETTKTMALKAKKRRKTITAPTPLTPTTVVAAAAAATTITAATATAVTKKKGKEKIDKGNDDVDGKEMERKMKAIQSTMENKLNGRNKDIHNNSMNNINVNDYVTITHMPHETEIEQTNKRIIQTKSILTDVIKIKGNKEQELLHHRLNEFMFNNSSSILHENDDYNYEYNYDYNYAYDYNFDDDGNNNCNDNGNNNDNNNFEDDEISIPDTSYERRQSLVGEWIEQIHLNSDYIENDNDYYVEDGDGDDDDDHIFNYLDVYDGLYQMRTGKEYDLYLLDRLKAEEQHAHITCYEPNCSFRTNSLLKMMIHDYQAHFKRCRFRCDKCGDYFTSKVFLDYHLDRQNRGFYWCYKCGQNFNYRNQLERHFIMHNKYANYCCNYCKCEFLTKIDLLEHCKNLKHDPNGERKLIRYDRRATITNASNNGDNDQQQHQKHDAEQEHQQRQQQRQKQHNNSNNNNNKNHNNNGRRSPIIIDLTKNGDDGELCTSRSTGVRSSVRWPTRSVRVGKIHFNNPLDPNCWGCI